MGEIFLVIIIVLAVLVVIFIVLRELVCWYWKINEIVKLLSSIDAKLSNNFNVNGEGRVNIIQEAVVQPESSKLSRINNESEASVEQAIKNVKVNTIKERIPKGLTETEYDSMQKYGITFENDKYVYKTYKYDVLEYAINYARQCEEREKK